MKTLYLIDGYAQFFRAYHAIRTPMTSPVTKEPTNMTFGFIGMLFRLLRGEGNLGGTPDYIALTLDVSGDRGTFRSQLYPDYKAHRPDPPEDLFPQVDRCLALLEAIGMPIIGAPEFEADDVIATLVAKLRKAHPDLKIRIISKDKDLKQLLRDAGPNEPGVELYDVHTDLAITASSLKAETGITPEQVIDMLTLMGDTVDNVPGVDGVGPKTAAQLIAQYGTLDALIADAANIKGKRGENIRAAIPMLPLSKQLVTLRTDAPADLDLNAARSQTLRLANLNPILKELGFNRYQTDLANLMGVPPPIMIPSPDVPNPATDRIAPKQTKQDDGGGLFGGTPSTPDDAPKQTKAPSKAAADAPPPVGGLFDFPAAAPTLSRPPTAGYACVRTKKDLDAVVKALQAAPIFAIDTETTSLSPRQAKLCGISIAIEPGAAWYIPVRSPTPSDHLDEATVLAALRPILEDPSKPKLGHNLKYDLLVLRAAGVELRGLTHPGSCDSMVASYLIDASRSSHSLDALSLALLNHTNISISELIGTGKDQRTFDTVPVDLATEYAAEDADVSLRLAHTMQPQLKAMGLTDLMQKLELPLVEVLAELEWNGITVDGNELERQRGRLQTRIDELAKAIQKAAMDTIGRGFNPDSPKQLAGVLFNKPDDEEPGLGLKVVKRTKTGASTDIEVLEKLAADPDITTTIPSLIVEYRQLTKLVSTYLVALKEAILPETGRVHASFHQTVAATGRLASSDPNLQNIPIRTDVGREIRKAFVAPPGRLLLTADYSQIELRLLAHLSQDPGLIEAFTRGEDIHTQVAAQIHNIPIKDVTKDQRSGAKMVNFGIVYGITAFGLARRLNIGNTEAAQIIDGYKRRFAGITTFLEECIAQARTHGYVETMMKRRRPIPDIDSTNPSRKAFAERTAINSVVQGSAADLIKLAMVDLHARLSPHASHLRGGKPPEVPGTLMLLQIHDELVFEVPREEGERARACIKQRMESAMTLSVPLVADASLSENWFEGK
ncbi:MAG: DNA polymerase I [Phycisphaeraceae bacterium]|nr:MAG: DNA polymerase I [Phycisphaeraceae bacterium]